MLPSFQVSTPPVGQLPVRVAFSSPHTLSLLAVICGAVGAGWVVIVTGVEATEVPQLLTHVAVYVPAPTCLGLAVVLSFHCTVPLVQVAVRVAISVPQSVVLLATIDGAVGAGWLVITTGIEAGEVPQLLTQVAVYVPGPTRIGLPVLLLFQVSTPPVGQLPVRVAFSSPHTLSLLAVICGAVGAGWVVITTGVEATEVPQLLTHVAVYVPAPTCLGLAVVLSFHCTVPLVQVAVRVAISVPQSVVLLATIDGAVGAGWVVITTGVEATEVPQLLTHVAV